MNSEICYVWGHSGKQDSLPNSNLTKFASVSNSYSRQVHGIEVDDLYALPAS